MEAPQRRQFSREFKLMALRRMETAESVQALADELGVERERLYRWRAKFVEGGEEGLRRFGRPRSRPASRLPDAEQIRADLERKIEDQARMIDFLKHILVQTEAPLIGGFGAPPKRRG